MNKFLIALDRYWALLAQQRGYAFQAPLGRVAWCLSDISAQRSAEPGLNERASEAQPARTASGQIESTNPVE